MESAEFKNLKFEQHKKQNVSKRVLIIDDEAFPRELLRFLFETDGYQCEEAENGEIGLALLENHQIDFIVTDNCMPVLTGLEFLDRLARQFKDQAPPVIMVTGHLTSEVKEQALKAGVAEVLTKPFDLHEIRSIVNSLFINPSRKFYTA